jgi:hypothetical protein
MCLSNTGEIMADNKTDKFVMDAVDKHQEDQIVSLQKTDVAHNKELLWLKVVGTILTFWMVVSMAITMMALDLIRTAMSKMEMIPTHSTVRK